MKARNRLHPDRGNSERAIVYRFPKTMQQIDISKAEKWPEPHHRNGVRAPMHLDLPCPHEGCGKPTFPIRLNWQFHNTCAVTQIKCAGCEQTISYFIANAPCGCDSIEESETAIFQHI